MHSELTLLLNQAGAEIVKFVDITRLPVNRTKGYPVAILLGIPLSAGYLDIVASTHDYVGEMKRQKQMHRDEFHNTELKTDGLADYVCGFLMSKGYAAYSQSERNLLATGHYDTTSQTTLLPHKTIALMAGMGWIGKHDLLVTPEYGSAISMCTVLTNAPLPAVLHPVAPSRCGDCTICEDECAVNAIKGTEWKLQVARDELVDVNACNTCLRCMVLCPWTMQYVRKASANGHKRYSERTK